MSGESLLFSVVHLSAAIAAWIATYALHSTLVLGLIVLLLRTALRNAAPGDRDVALKVALLGGIVTATLVTAGAGTPALGVYDVSWLVEMRRWNGIPIVPPVRELLPQSQSLVFGARLPDGAALLRIVPPLLVVGWVAYAALVLLRVLSAAMRARGALGPRRDVMHSELRATFDQILGAFRVRGPVRLTATSAIVSPVALGGGEVCVPDRLLLEFSAEEQRSVLAHETAHLARRDPWWLLLAATIEAVFFFQPLNRMARMQLQEEAELLADDLAVRELGDGVVLARCLAKVAEWMSVDPGRISRDRLLAPALAESRSSLLARVRRLLGEQHGAVTPHPSRARHWNRAAMAGVPFAVLLIAPAFTGGGVRAWGTPAFHWEGTLAKGETIEIDGTMGSIRAEPWEGNSVVVNATRHGRATVPDITFQVVRHPLGVTICAIYPVPAGRAANECLPNGAGARLNTPANDVEVEFLVRVPRAIAFTARTATGAVTTGLLTAPVIAHSTSGDVDVATTAYAEASSKSGNVTVDMGQTDWPDTLRIASSSGNIAVTLPEQANTIVDASTAVGAVRSNITAVSGYHLGFWRRLALRGSLGEHASGTLGRGGRVLLLSSTAGDIAVRQKR